MCLAAQHDPCPTSALAWRTGGTRPGLELKKETAG
jgi:hypothetical protein